MKWMLLFLFIILAGSAYAEVDSVSSGVFRGSMRHIVTISTEDTVGNVAAGDYLSFRFADGQYLTSSDHEELDVYVRRFDSRLQTMTFDTNTEKFLEVAVGDEYPLDVNFDGIDDVVLSFESLDRRGVFVARDITVVPKEEISENLFEEPCDTACFSDEDCDGSCVYPGTCDATCVASETQIDPPSLELDAEPTDDVEVVETEKGWFTRFVEWLARLI